MVGLEKLFYIIFFILCLASFYFHHHLLGFFSIKFVESGRGDTSARDCMPKALLHGFANKDNAVPEGQDGFGG